MRSLGNAGDKIIRDQFDRLLHLYLAPRAQRRRVDMEAEALLSKVMNIDDMRPFPSQVAMSVRAIRPINVIDISSDDGTIAMASNDDRVGLVDPKTGRVFSEVTCLLYTSPSPRDLSTSRMPSSA